MPGSSILGPQPLTGLGKLSPSLTPNLSVAASGLSVGHVWGSGEARSGFTLEAQERTEAGDKQGYFTPCRAEGADGRRKPRRCQWGTERKAGQSSPYRKQGRPAQGSATSSG